MHYCIQNPMIAVDVIPKNTSVINEIANWGLINWYSEKVYHAACSMELHATDKMEASTLATFQNRNKQACWWYMILK